MKKSQLQVISQNELPLAMPLPKLVLPQPSAQEAAAVEVATKSVRARRRRTQLASSATPSEVVHLHPPHSDGAGFTFELRDAFGTTSGAFVRKQIDYIFRTVGNGDDGTADVDAVNSVIAMVDGMRPENEVQAALAVQLGLTHHMAAKMMALASLSMSLDQQERYINLATKLQRTMAVHSDTMTRLKGKPEGTQVGQVLTVTDGSQAIIGGTVNIDARRQENGG